LRSHRKPLSGASAVGVWWPVTRHGVPRAMFEGLWRTQELNGNTNRRTIYTGSDSLSSNSLYVQSSLAFCVGLIVWWLCVMACADLGSPALLYISQEASLLVRYNVRVIVGLQDSKNF
jgi:hypothetical protein